MYAKNVQFLKLLVFHDVLKSVHVPRAKSSLHESLTPVVLRWDSVLGGLAPLKIQMERIGSCMTVL